MRMRDIGESLGLLRKDVERANQAKALLEDPLLVEAFESIRTRYLTEWEKTPARDAEGREQIWKMVKTLDQVSGHLRGTLENGKIAAKKITDLEKRSKFRAVA